MKPFLSILFHLITSIRNFFYDHKILSSTSIKVPVISVGNIEMGGTGKTPVVLYLSKLLLNSNFKPGIISRGYKRSSSGQQIVCDGEKIFFDASFVGDEPFLLAKLSKKTPIIVNKNRVSAAKFMIKNFDVNVIILDDGFQHRKINRSIDIALLNINTPIKSLNLFPLGRLREHFKNIYRADILLITKQNPLSKTKNIQFANNLYFHNKFFVSNSFRLFNPLSNIEIEKNVLLKNIFAFCGIGDPENFKQSLLSLKINPSFFKAFNDHQNYNLKIISDFENLIFKKNIKTIITTEKDYIKLPINFCKTYSVLVLKMNYIFDKNFDSLILKLL